MTQSSLAPAVQATKKTCEHLKWKNIALFIDEGTYFLLRRCCNCPLVRLLESCAREIKP
jgi:hypothetical protein